MGCACCKQREAILDNFYKESTVDGTGNSDLDNDIVGGMYSNDLYQEKSQQVRAWNRSLHKMAMTVIDVNSFDNCDQIECREKQTFYASKLSEIKIHCDGDDKSGKIKTKKNISKNLVNKAKINTDDLLLINGIANLSRECLQNAFQIQYNESIIAEFDLQKDDDDDNAYSFSKKD